MKTNTNTKTQWEGLAVDLDRWHLEFIFGPSSYSVDSLHKTMTQVFFSKIFIKLLFYIYIYIIYLYYIKFYKLYKIISLGFFPALDDYEIPFATIKPNIVSDVSPHCLNYCLTSQEGLSRKLPKG